MISVSEQSELETNESSPARITGLSRDRARELVEDLRDDQRYSGMPSGPSKKHDPNGKVRLYAVILNQNYTAVLNPTGGPQ